MSSELTYLIDKLVADKTFSVEAAEGIKRLRDANMALTDKVQELEAESKSTEDSYFALKRQHDDQAFRLSMLSQREANIAKRELEMTKLEKEKAVAEAKLDGFREGVSTVWKPSQVREVVQSTVPLMGHSYNYNNGVSSPCSDMVQYHNKTESITKSAE